MKYALVTGANRGLGLGFCQALVEKGYVVFAAVRDLSTFHYTHERIKPIEMHIDRDESIIRAFAELAARGEHIDLLVNNAGVSKRSASVGSGELVCELDKIDRRALLHMFDVNAVSPLVVIRHCLPLMSGRDCFIINITSGRASFANDGGSNANYGYRASKAALNMFTQALVRDLPKNVQTFAVHPGLVATDMHPDGEIEPIDAARNILTMLDSWDPANNGAFLDDNGIPFPS